MKYRIVPTPDGKFYAEYNMWNENDYDYEWYWHRLSHGRYFWSTNVFNTIEGARKVIEKQKEIYRKADEEAARRLEFEKNNPPIYIDP